MKGIYLRFYMYEFEKHKGELLFQWLLEFAKQNGVPGGSAFKAIGGFGHAGSLHMEHFFESASNVPIEVTFVMEKAKSKEFLDLLKNEGVSLFWVESEVEFGRLN